MKRQTPWRLCRAGVLVDRDADGSRLLVWINPILTPAPLRGARPLCVELLYSFADLAKTNAGLRVVSSAFRHDSTLAAISRSDDSTRVLIYTEARQFVAEDRARAVRAVLRPPAAGLRIATEPHWESLISILSTSAMLTAGAAE